MGECVWQNEFETIIHMNNFLSVENKESFELEYG
jgi:hypothetical protein